MKQHQRVHPQRPWKNTHFEQAYILGSLINVLSKTEKCDIINKKINDKYYYRIRYNIFSIVQ